MTTQLYRTSVRTRLQTSLQANTVGSSDNILNKKSRGCHVTFQSNILRHLDSKIALYYRQHYSEEDIVQHKEALTKARKRRYKEKQDKLRAENTGVSQYLFQ